MTFQAVIILTCNFWFVFGSFLACEQLSNYGEQSEPGENARARAEAPRTGELARRREDVSIVCQRRKPFKSRNTRLHRQTSLFFVI